LGVKVLLLYRLCKECDLTLGSNGVTVVQAV
jgi:hypothetical protein